MTVIRFDSPVTVQAADMAGRRELAGLAVPWNVTANTSAGPVQFLPGSLPTDGDAPKLIRDHDLSQPIGIVTGRENTPDGMRFTARISATTAGNDALALAADGVLDAVSVGVEPVDFVHVDGVMVVAAGRWRELSLVPFGAFPAARVDMVAAAEIPTTTEPETPEKEPEPMTDDPIIPTAPIVTATATAPVQVTAAEYVSHYLSGTMPASIRAALQDSNDGVVPEPILLPVYDGLRADRPLCDAVGVEGMPGTGRTFSIPKITQRPTVGLQAAEGDTLSSQAMIVTPVTVDKTTRGGWADLTEQDIDWTIPAAVQLTIDQLARAYARQTEAAACSALITGATVTDTITDWTDADEVLTAIFTAATTIVGSTGSMPTHILCAPDRYKDLAVLKSTSGEYLFPSLNPMNAYGRLDASSLQGTPAGLRLVVSPQFAAGSFVVGAPSGAFRLFEQRKGSVMVDQPANLSVRLAWRGYFATCMMDSAAFVKFV